ncbi:hypothetical protein CCAX7_003070 [Capsulimonas corticalis]|uniref:Uncharacterized protein n=1 Tax=Capsulimonas corticalis TaxID=2219043 RepID=A0A402CS58_9BACT|nr:AraC family transcriptional regulator [Capsulimonas corticalis]BDI28256.1 hypothetical protein CCAX7_003070 [Capsulimonas corticalis]
MDLNIETRQLHYTSAKSPIGFVEWSCIYQDSHWNFEGMRTLDLYAMSYILEGRCRYTDPDGLELFLESGDLLFCAPGSRNRMEPAPGRQFSEVWVTFGGPIFDLWRDAKLLSHSKMLLHLEPLDYWLGRFEGLFEGNRDQIQLVSAVQALLADMLPSDQSWQSNVEDREWLGMAKKLLTSVERAEDLDLVGIATEMNMSYSSFRRKFTALSHISPGRYHMTMLIERACQWMSESHITNKEIAERCGFCNEFHFSQRFKQIVGVPPREFRRRAHGNEAVARTIDAAG